jgi:phospholipid transport system substrate-binding protein
MRPSRLILPVALVLLFVAALPLRPAAAADANAFMLGIGNRVLDIVNDKTRTDAQHKEQFLELAQQSFDIPKIAQFVLGRYWRSASDDEKTRFLAAFTSYMVQVYWSRFNSYAGETFQVTGSKDEGNGTILVTTMILRTESGQPPVKVDWSVVPSGPSFKIRDASLEGVSQAITYREEFASIIERNGGKVSDLIDQLNTRAKG